MSAYDDTFGRSCELIVDGRTLVQPDMDLGGQLRVTFDVRQFTTSTPNLATITVYNLSRNSARDLKEAKTCTLSAGYQGNMGQVFTGQTIQVRVGKENATDTTLIIDAADGDTGHNFATINTSVAKNRTPLDLVMACVVELKKQGIMVGYLAEDELQRFKYPRGQLLFGMVRDVLDRVCRSQGCLWSIKANKLVIVPAHKPFIPAGSPIPVNVKSGMVGIPEQTLEGIRVTTFINPQISIGSQLLLNNGDIQRASVGQAIGGADPQSALLPAIDADGLYNTLKLDIEGDTRGQPWYMKHACLAASGAGGQPASLIPYLGAGTVGNTQNDIPYLAP